MDRETDREMDRDREQDWKIVDRAHALDNSWIRVYRDQCRTGGGVQVRDYFTVEKPDYATIVAVNSDAKLILVRQYKHGSRKQVLELPAGYIDAGEDPPRAATRELLEETGYQAQTIVPLGVLYTSPAVLTNRAHAYFSDDLIDTGRQNLDLVESIEIVTLPLLDVWHRPQLLSDISSVAALYLARPHLQRQGWLP